MSGAASVNIPPINPEPLDPPILPPDDPRAPDEGREPSIDPPPTAPPVQTPGDPAAPTHPQRARRRMWNT